MDETHVVTCFLRNDGLVLLFRRSEDVGSYSGQWGAVAGHAEGDPDSAARREIREETGVADAVSLLRTGEPFEVVDEDLDKRWVVHPYLFDCATREIDPNWETTEYAWVHPTEILRRDTVPDLWTSYDCVRPTIETVSADHDHGSAYVSIRALEVLRDLAGLYAVRGSGGWDEIASLARDLLAVRPTMTVIENRVNRVMATVETRTPAGVEQAAREVIDQAVDADAEAAETARAQIRGARVATLSRSGTVLEALCDGEPQAVLVAESRPGGEGVGVAEEIAAETAVTLTSDAAMAYELNEWDADAVLVGADTILADGRVVNKVGTRAAAVVSSHEGINCYVVTSADKINPDEAPALEASEEGLYDGDANIAVKNPLFDVTPADCIDAIYTERGILDGEDVAAIAAEFQAYREWRA